MLQEISVIDDGNFKFVYELEKEINFNKEHIRISKNKSSEMEEVLKNIPSLILIHEERLEEKTEKIIDMQILYTAICYQLSMTIGLYIMGAIWDINSSLVFYVSAGIALVGTIFATRIREK